MVKIICDSAADFTTEEIERLKLNVLSLIVIGEEEEYEDGCGINSRELFQRMEEGEVFKTSQVPINRFLDQFDFYGQRGIDFIYYGISSEISGTVAGAEVALKEISKKYPNVKMAVIDSKSATAGCAMGVEYLVKAVQQEYSFEDLLELAHFFSENISHIFTLEDLKFLYRGGRLSKSQMIMGNFLNIMPIIELKNGKLEVVDKARGKNSAYKKIVDRFGESVKGRDISNERFSIVYGKDISQGKELKEKIQSQFPLAKNIDLRGLGTVIGAHTGPYIRGVISLRQDLANKFKSLY